MKYETSDIKSRGEQVARSLARKGVRAGAELGEQARQAGEELLERSKEVDLSALPEEVRAKVDDLLGRADAVLRKAEGEISPAARAAGGYAGLAERRLARHAAEAAGRAGEAGRRAVRATRYADEGGRRASALKEQSAARAAGAAHKAARMASEASVRAGREAAAVRARSKREATVAAAQAQEAGAVRRGAGAGASRRTKRLLRMRHLVRPLAFGLGLLLAYRKWGRGYVNSWGATAEETRTALPGDALVPSPRRASTRAVTIQATPAAVWPWLAQMGQGRGGLYSYDWLENLAGCDLHSADRILPEHQDLAVGDEVRLVKPDFPVDLAFEVAHVEPERALVLKTPGVSVEALSKGMPYASWAFVLQPVSPDSTRLLVRWRSDFKDTMTSRFWNGWGVELPHFLMERKMLQGVRCRAERGREDAPSAPPAATVGEARFQTGAGMTAPGREPAGESPANPAGHGAGSVSSAGQSGGSASSAGQGSQTDR